VLTQLKGNDVIHSLEHGLKLSFLLAMNLSGRKMQTINEFKGEDDKSINRWGDLVIESDRIHVEYKNIKVDQVQLADGRRYDPSEHWERGIDIAKEIQKLNVEELLTLKIYGGSQTVKDAWENAIKQTKENQKWISKKIGAQVDSFCVLKIGLYRLKYAKV
jgi:hypothetical protein